MESSPGVDTQLLQDALVLGGHHSEGEVINAALREYVLRCQRRKLLDEFGKIAFDDAFDYKSARRDK